MNHFLGKCSKSSLKHHLGHLLSYHKDVGSLLETSGKAGGPRAHAVKCETNGPVGFHPFQLKYQNLYYTQIQMLAF